MQMRRVAKRALKFAGYGLAGVLAVAAIALSLTIGWRPVMGSPNARLLTDRRFEATPARLARGRYLVEGVAECFDCHATVEFQGPGQPVRTTRKGSGRIFEEHGDFRIVAPNITPDRATGAGTWTDDQLARAIREGVGHDGRALFPIMPYQKFREMSDEDLASVIVYIRSLEPVYNPLPPRRLPFPLSRIVNALPQPVTSSVTRPTTEDPRKRGEYLVTLASCGSCHTPGTMEGKPRTDMAFGGGEIFTEAGYPVASANITPDASGISYYDEATFIKTLRTGHVGARPLNAPMPWWIFRNMSDEDLKAIFAYLQTLKPVRHRVDNAETTVRCPVCGNKHGVGGGTEYASRRTVR